MSEAKKVRPAIRLQDTKTRILDHAAREFYKNGYRPTGVDAVAKAVGITKATLYHHFQNKDALIEASLRYLSDYHRGQYVKAWNKKGLTPKAKLTILFDEMHGSFKEPSQYGCPFINAASEYTDRGSPVRKICEEHYDFLTGNLEKFAGEAGLNKPAIVAQQITACVAGVYSAWFVAGIKDAPRQGKKMAELIIANHSRA